jgi:hypothetical protein
MDNEEIVASIKLIIYHKRSVRAIASKRERGGFRDYLELLVIISLNPPNSFGVITFGWRINRQTLYQWLR